MRNILLLFILFLISYSCKLRDNESTNNEIILRTLNVAIDSITYGSLDSVVLIHKEKYPDNIKEITLKSFLAKGSKIDSEERRLFEKLLFQIKDSVKLALNNYRFKHNLITEDTRYSNSFGYVNLSNPIVNDNGSLACYYLAINCLQVNEDGCSVGFLILVEKEGENWKLKKPYQLWTGGSWEEVASDGG